MTTAPLTPGADSTTEPAPAHIDHPRGAFCSCECFQCRSRVIGYCWCRDCPHFDPLDPRHNFGTPGWKS